MTDVMTPQQRSRCMSRIRGKDTGPEILVRKSLWHAGLRYRVNDSLPGKPDIAFRSAKVAIFVDGCFWHGCPLHRVRPKANAEFWDRKFWQTMRRDREVNEKLRSLGWKVLRYWEHEVDTDLKRITAEVKRTLKRRGKIRHGRVAGSARTQR